MFNASLLSIRNFNENDESKSAVRCQYNYRHYFTMHYICRSSWGGGGLFWVLASSFFVNISKLCEHFIVFLGLNHRFSKCLNPLLHQGQNKLKLLSGINDIVPKWVKKHDHLSKSYTTFVFISCVLFKIWISINSELQKLLF